MEPKLQKLQEMMKMLNEGLTREEFLSAFKEVVKIVKDLQATNKKEFELVHEFTKKFSGKMQSDTSMTLAEMKKQVNQVFVGERMDAMQRMIDDSVKEAMEKMHSKMTEVDTTVSERMKKVRDGYTPVKGKDYFDGKHGNVLTPIEVRDKLETLSDGEKLSIQAVQDLPKLLEEMKRVASSRAVGGLISKRIRFVDDETPSGTVNGSNTIFTISRAPETGSLKVYVNGSRMRVTEDYTLSGKTITFVTAPPTGSILLVDFRY